MKDNRSPDAIREMVERIRRSVPAHRFVFTDPFWMLITTVLSQRTKDETTDAAARSLFERYRDVDSLANADPEDVGRIIGKVGFWRVKSKKIVEIARIIKDRYGGKVPESIDDLTSLPGVGLKTAKVVLAEGFHVPSIAVDTHVFRISHRIGWSSARTPEETSVDLENLIPKDLQIGFNPMMVEFGKAICRPMKPLCDRCPISEYCKFYSERSGK
ncbi:endonuclease III [Thermoplasma sp.]|uniref:endonuclease III domain-containing protein n=1 Tax=Thermoplasma sp. TaxID=1973142 RepID=UPI002620A80D|nr:endonuclease III [Thermoplasma sp.]